MAKNDEGTNDRWRKFLLPGAASLVGAGAGLVLTKTDKLRDNLPSLDSVGIGDLVDDLKTKVGSTSGSGSGSNSSTSGNARSTLSSDELEQHRRRRADARKQRARR